MSHRFDKRTKEEFAKDIKRAHSTEIEIAVRLAIAVHAKTKKWPDIKPNGIDSTGTFIEDDKKITAAPDFIIGDRVVEITRSGPFCHKVFHEKCNKVDSMLKNGTDMVFVNGYDVHQQPDFIWLKGSTWAPFVQRSKTKYGITPILGGGKIGFMNKKGYRFDTYWFTEANLWRPLPVMIRNIPKQYKELLNQIKA